MKTYVVNWDIMENTSEFLDCLDSLKKVNNGIHRQEVILWKCTFFILKKILQLEKEQKLKTFKSNKK